MFRLLALFDRMTPSTSSPQEGHFQASKDLTKSKYFSEYILPLHFGQFILSSSPDWFQKFRMFRSTSASVPKELPVSQATRITA
jgi:hypothetical protein